MDDILTGRRPSTKKCEQLSLTDSEYVDDTGVLFPSVDIDNVLFMSIVDRFCYLGSVLTRDYKDTLDVESRIKSASHAF